MASCEVCGNEYDRTMEIIVGGERHVFDSFECAIHAIAPRWSTVSAASSATASSPAMPLYCGAHCAHESGVAAARHRV